MFHPARGLVIAALLACSCASTPDNRAEPSGGPPYQVISGGPVKPPVALYRVIPDRPAGVDERGQVLLKTIIGLDGNAREITVIRAPHPKLGKVAVEAVKQWRFTPGTLHGKPVETIFLVQIIF